MLLITFLQLSCMSWLMLLKLTVTQDSEEVLQRLFH